jgi:hypothetical protein
MAWSRVIGKRQRAAASLEGQPATAKVFVSSTGQLDSLRLAASAEMAAQLRHAIETEATGKSLRSATHLELRGPKKRSTSAWTNQSGSLPRTGALDLDFRRVGRVGLEPTTGGL